MVGGELLRVLAQRKFPSERVIALASERSKGLTVAYDGQTLEVGEITESAFNGVDVALFASSGDIALMYGPVAAEAGALVIDNSSAWRMKDNVPLVVPEVNREDIRKNEGIIANPNCCAIPLTVILHPLQKKAGLERVLVSTYQSASGAGRVLVDELEEQTKAIAEGEEPPVVAYPYQLAYNVVPGGWRPEPGGYNEEEVKIVNETRKILHEPELRITATCVRVPVPVGHGESVFVETAEKISADEVREKLAVMLVNDGSDGVVVSGTTGESPSLSDAEKIELLRAVKNAIPGKSVVAGTGSNDTHHSVELSELAMKAGADALLAVVPYYNKPPQDGMYQHFKAISEVGPTIMYNIQGRTAVNMTAATTLRCAELPGIIGVKEASGDLDQIGLVCAGKPDRFRVWSGDDSWTLPVMAVGGYGVICVVSHIAGRSMARLIEAARKGENDVARDIHHGLLPVSKTLMTTAANPVPIKSALNAMGFNAGPFRLPLVPLTDEQLKSVLKTIRDAGEYITFAKPGVKVA